MKNYTAEVIISHIRSVREGATQLIKEGKHFNDESTLHLLDGLIERLETIFSPSTSKTDS